MIHGERGVDIGPAACGYTEAEMGCKSIISCCPNSFELPRMHSQHNGSPSSEESNALDAVVDSTTGSSRRSFVLMGMGLLLAGCAGSKTATTMLPSPVWRPREYPTIDDKIASPAPLPVMPTAVIPRTQWASTGPVPALMNPMLPVQFITVHHDGMEPFYATDQGSTAARLEAIRRAHRDRGWGDIGYHFAIDRNGRVWQARPLNWQGAHVKDHNEGNIGVVNLGNFDRQSPSAPQIAALNRHVSMLMRQYKVSLARLRTHQEWAPTACPGTNMQRYMVAVRANRQIG